MSTVALAAVQLGLSMDDFASEAAFADRIDAAASRAAAATGDARERLLVFPENTGHFIPLIHAPKPALRMATLDRAMAAVAALRPLAIAGAMWRERLIDVPRAVLLSLMPTADPLMRRVFSTVARHYRAWVVAGSHLRVVGSAVTNTSYTFSPDGRLVATTDKINLVPGLEDASPGGLGLARGDADRLPVICCGWGRLATLICYDGFCQPHTTGERFVDMTGRADAAGADVIANPAANPWPWNQRWVFAPPGVNTPRCEQWEREGLPASLAGLRHVRYGVTAHLCGRIFDLEFAGRSEIFHRNASNIEYLDRADRDDQASIAVAYVPFPQTAS